MPTYLSLSGFLSIALPILSTLVAGIVGGLVVGRYAVIWALERYKTEKTWERKLDGYLKAITAMNDMKVVSESHMEAAMLKRELSVEVQDVLALRYKEANQGLDKSAAMAQLLLSEKSAKLLSSVPKQLNNVSEAQGTESALDDHIHILNCSIEQLIRNGKEELELKQ